MLSTRFVESRASLQETASVYFNQHLVNIYVESQLQELGITQAEAARRSNVPEELLDRFLTDLSRLTLAEKLRVAIMFGSVLGDPVQLAMIAGSS